jgi:hypothetical protein
MKLIVVILSFINGAFMLIDGIHVMLKGKYIGPAKPGPWAGLFENFNVDVFKLGPLFVLFGVLWLTLLIGIWTSQSWAFAFGVILSLLTLWYLPVGTAISLLVLLLLIFARAKLGL